MISVCLCWCPPGLLLFSQGGCCISCAVWVQPLLQSPRSVGSCKEVAWAWGGPWTVVERQDWDHYDFKLGITKSQVSLHASEIWRFFVLHISLVLSTLNSFWLWDWDILIETVTWEDISIITAWLHIQWTEKPGWYLRIEIVLLIFCVFHESGSKIR